MKQDEYNTTCDRCSKTGDHMFARIYHTKINNEWMYLCSSCWDKPKGKVIALGSYQSKKDKELLKQFYSLSDHLD